MHSSARLGMLAAALLTAAVSVTAAPVLVTSAQAVDGPSVAVHGRLLVVPPETPGGPTGYGVALADGDIVPVRGPFGPGVRTGAEFTGRLGLPSSVLAALSRRGETGSSAALRVVDRRSLALSVVGTPSITAAPEVSNAVTPTTHQQFVAALDNKGALNQTDAQLLAHVSTVGSYWETQSSGAISGITVPATVKHYDTATGTTACGLGSGQAGVNDFFNLLDEAAQKFPAIDLSSSSPDQLVLFVPEACSSGSTVGRGTVGTSFASGGLLIAESSASIDGVYAHETGHNYGFEHANARVSGSSLEYYGIYDVMGFALPPQYNMLTALSTPFRVFQGITDPGEIQDVSLGNGLSPVHATATIAPRSNATGVRSIRVKDPDTGESLYLDYRSGTGVDAGSAYAAVNGLSSGNGPLFYAPGVTINAARATGGNDVLADAAGDTSFGVGSTWTNASGLLTVSVTAITPTSASVAVDFSPPQDFTTVGTPVVGGTVKVGGTVTLDTGSWSPTPTSTQIRWTADGQALADLDDKTQFTAGPELVGTQLVATVTQRRAGYKPTSAASAGVTVGTGTIPTTANPGISGTAKVGFILTAQSGSWSTVLGTVTSSYRWQRDGADIAGATGPDYQVVSGDVGSAIRVVQTVHATGYAPATLTSPATGTVPTPVIDPAPTPTLTGTPRVGTPLHVSTGTWMTGVGLGYQWYVAGVPVSGATGRSYTPVAGDRGKTVRVRVTGTRSGYPSVTRTSAESAAVGIGRLAWTKPVVTGTPKVGKRLKAQPGFWTAGTRFSYSWFADGKRIKHQTGARLGLTKAQKGKRITVRVTGKKPGYASVSKTSARTLRVL